MVERQVASQRGQSRVARLWPGLLSQGGDGWRGSDFERGLNVVNMVTDMDLGQAQAANPIPN